jgi:hypothetical protein
MFITAMEYIEDIQAFFSSRGKKIDMIEITEYFPFQ